MPLICTLLPPLIQGDAKLDQDFIDYLNQINDLLQEICEELEAKGVDVPSNP